MNGAVYLEHLGLYGSGIRGTLPTEIGRLTNLEYLIFAQTSISGTMPTEIGLLNQMTYLVFVR